MESYNIIKVGRKEICYRVYGSRAGKGIEVVNGTDLEHREIAREFFSWWHFDPVKEAKRIYRLSFGKIKKTDWTKYKTGGSPPVEHTEKRPAYGGE